LVVSGTVLVIVASLLELVALQANLGVLGDHLRLDNSLGRWGRLLGSAVSNWLETVRRIGIRVIDVSLSFIADLRSNFHSRCALIFGVRDSFVDLVHAFARLFAAFRESDRWRLS